MPFVGPAALAPGGNRLFLRAPQMADFQQWAELREYSLAYLTPWEPICPLDDLTRSGFRRRVRRYCEDVVSDRFYPFLVFRKRITKLTSRRSELANVRRGIVQSGTIGYWIGRLFAHQGYMTEALQVLLPTLFGTLKLYPALKRPAFRSIDRQSGCWRSAFLPAMG